MSIDRHADGYEPRFDIDAEVGRQGELFIDDIIDALQRASSEIKKDEKTSRTGNFYVEFACRCRDGWEKSGIATTSAEVYAFVIGDSAWIVPTNRLKELARQRKQEYGIAECNRGNNPTKGVLVPVAWMVEQMRGRA